ncbi:MAG TPA: hypothetical protein VLN48_17910 [Bryobacteraceae bacterium]|nr:hypothetical protein [Bryobacteraceae bacterium]
MEFMCISRHRARLCNTEYHNIRFPYDPRRAGHFTLEEGAQILAQAERKLRPGGRFISIQRNFQLEPRRYFDDNTHRTPYTDAGFQDFLRSLGWRIVHAEPRFTPFTLTRRLDTCGGVRLPARGWHLQRTRSAEAFGPFGRRAGGLRYAHQSRVYLAGANMGPFLRWGNWAVAKMTEFLFNTTMLTDMGCTYRAFDRRAMERIRPFLKIGGSHFGPQLLMEVIAHGIPFIEIPVNYRRRVGESSVTGDLEESVLAGHANDHAGTELPVWVA